MSGGRRFGTAGNHGRRHLQVSDCKFSLSPLVPISCSLFFPQATHRSAAPARPAAMPPRPAPDRGTRAISNLSPSAFSARSRSSRIFNCANLVGQRLARPRDVAVHLGLNAGLVDVRVLVEVVDHLLAGPVLGVRRPCPPPAGSPATCRPPAGRNPSTGPGRTPHPCPDARRTAPSLRCRPCSRRTCGTPAAPSSSCAMEICRWWPGMPS